ncbi:MAG: damage-inducible protein DinB [Rhodospirillales bacterium]|jgi:uncharacterized damage-inducible protein DinB|nr:damage-inducible protein DinB [Rhodospirillales bacterium]
MIMPSYVRTLAAYNSEMNRRIYAAAARLPDAARRAERGAFWGSLHGTLAHLLWGDTMWMSRFDGWDRPPVGMQQAAEWAGGFEAMAAARIRTDARLEDWAGRVDQAWLDQDLVWFSGAAQREMRAHRGFLVTHFFNHQTHHRGQAHALVTACGETTDDTDLMLILPGPR